MQDRHVLLLIPCSAHEPFANLWESFGASFKVFVFVYSWIKHQAPPCPEIDQEVLNASLHGIIQYCK